MRLKRTRATMKVNTDLDRRSRNRDKTNDSDTTKNRDRTKSTMKTDEK